MLVLRQMLVEDATAGQRKFATSIGFAEEPLSITLDMTLGFEALTIVRGRFYNAARRAARASWMAASTLWDEKRMGRSCHWMLAR